MTNEEAKRIDGAQHKLLQRILGFGPRPGGSRVSQITCIELAAQLGVVILPASVRMELGRLRYGGHIARRQVYLGDRNKPCIQMDMLGKDVGIIADDSLKTGGKAPGLMTFATLIKQSAEKVTQGGRRWDVRAKVATKAGWRRYLKADATRALMESWLQSHYDGKSERSAKAQASKASGVVADYHDKACSRCKRIWYGGAKAGHSLVLMCSTCDHVEHLECTGRNIMPPEEERFTCATCTRRENNLPSAREGTTSATFQRYQKNSLACTKQSATGQLSTRSFTLRGSPYLAGKRETTPSRTRRPGPRQAERLHRRRGRLLAPCSGYLPKERPEGGCDTAHPPVHRSQQAEISVATILGVS